jgi:hypothetical protein
MANVVSLQGANFVAERQLPASGPVVLDDSTGLNVFGNFHSIPYTPYLSSRSTGFKLYIDGKLIASDKVTYSLPSTLPVGPPVALKSIALGASSVNGGSTLQAVVSLVATAPEGGEVVTLASDNAAASVPASVTVPAGQSALSFTVFTRIVTSDATAVITATAGSVTKSATLTVTAPR